jgi:branched-chain amino acid transport system permease protein
VALGGRSFFLGPLLGAIVLEATRSYVQTHSANADLVVGAVVILCALLFPEGMGPALRQWLARNPAQRLAVAAVPAKKGP